MRLYDSTCGTGSCLLRTTIWPRGQLVQAWNPRLRPDLGHYPIMRGYARHCSHCLISANLCAPPWPQHDSQFRGPFCLCRKHVVAEVRSLPFCNEMFRACSRAVQAGVHGLHRALWRVTPHYPPQPSRHPRLWKHARPRVGCQARGSRRSTCRGAEAERDAAKLLLLLHAKGVKKDGTMFPLDNTYTKHVYSCSGNRAVAVMRFKLQPEASSAQP